MPSKELTRLRNHMGELIGWYSCHQRPGRGRSLADLKAMRRGYHQAGDREMVAIIDKDLKARHADARTRLAELTASLCADAEAIKQRAIRKRPPATEAAKQAIRHILESPHATPSTIAQWIVSNHRDEPAYWSALQEVAGEQQARGGLVGEPAKRAAHFVAETESAIASYEKFTLSPQEAERARELEDVRMSMNHLEQNLKEADTFLQREEAGLSSNRLPDHINRWPGLPDDNLCTNGYRIPLTDKAGNFAPPQLQEV